MSTVIISSLVFSIVAFIIIRGIINLKKGKHSCSCGCSCKGCAMSSLCHAKEMAADESKD